MARQAVRTAPSSVAWPRRRHFFWLAVSFTAVAAYGSLVPLDFAPVPWPDAVAHLEQVLRSPVRIVSRSDWAANVLLFVPLGFLWLGAVALDRPRLAAMGMAVPLVPLLAVLSAAIELAQCWLPSRTVSQNDVVAETLGGMAGIALWLGTGPRIVRGMRQYAATRRPAGAIEWVLHAYLLGLLLCRLMPLDLTLRPGELYRKLKMGRIVLVPFLHMRGSTGEVLFAIAQLLVLAIPVGAAAALCLGNRSQKVRPFLASCLLGAAIVGLIELARVPVYSRRADVTNVVVGCVGAALGAALTHRLATGSLVWRPTRSLPSRPAPATCHEAPRSQREESDESRRQRAGPRPHVPGMDGLRAVACLAVFGVHWQQMTGLEGKVGPLDLARLLANGNTGVCLFFLLSGALLSLPLWQGDFRQMDRGWLAGYAARRPLRILPAYYACLFALILWRGRGGNATNAALHLLFLHNLSEGTFYGYAPPFWTIAVQAQFYVLLPLVFYALAWWGRARPGRELLLLALLAGAYLAHFLLMENGRALGAWLGQPDLLDRQPTVFSHSVLAHLPHLLLGVWAGLHLSDRGWLKQWLALRPRWLCDVLAGGTLLALGAILATTLDDLLRVPHGRYHFPFVPLLVATLIVATPRSRAALWLLDKTPLRRLGVISFGVYVYHYPLMRFTTRAMDQLGLPPTTHWLTFALASLGLSILVSWLSYRFIEAPLLRPVRTAD